jgi:hypothetical protein
MSISLWTLHKEWKPTESYVDSDPDPCPVRCLECHRRFSLDSAPSVEGFAYCPCCGVFWEGEWTKRNPRYPKLECKYDSGWVVSYLTTTTGEDRWGRSKTQIHWRWNSYTKTPLRVEALINVRNHFSNGYDVLALTYVVAHHKDPRGQSVGRVVFWRDKGVPPIVPRALCLPAKPFSVPGLPAVVFLYAVEERLIRDW